VSRVASFLLVAMSLAIACAPADRTLHVERFVEGSDPTRFDPFDRTITDAAMVARVEEALLALRPITGPERFCPISWGLRYRLTFTKPLGLTRTAIIEADGCREAHLDPLDRRETTESFWALLADGLGLYTRGNDLFPLPREMRRP
jgi:hypothetical protein